jgi:hypothetical protein
LCVAPLYVALALLMYMALLCVALFPISGESVLFLGTNFVASAKRSSARIEEVRRRR